MDLNRRGFAGRCMNKRKGLRDTVGSKQLVQNGLFQPLPLFPPMLEGLLILSLNLLHNRATLLVKSTLSLSFEFKITEQIK